MTDFKNWLEKPYPLIEHPRQKLLLALGFGIFVYLFLLIFEPFKIYRITEFKSVFLGGFGICAFLGLLINYVLLPFVFPQMFHADKWNIKKEISYILWSFILIAIFNYSYNTIIGNGITAYKSLWEFLGITIAIGLFPVVILTFLIERNLSQKNLDNAKFLSKSLPFAKIVSKGDEALKIESETLKSAPFSIKMDDFVFATSDNNYTTIFYLKNKALQQELLRLSLKNLEEQVSGYTSMVRCHRSYLVNKDKITAINGNARSLTIHVDYYQKAIPVSRSFSRDNFV